MPPVPPIGPLIPTDFISDETDAGALIKKAVLVGTAATLALQLSFKHPQTTAFVSKALTGIEFNPAAKGVLAKFTPTPLVVTWLLPSPIGIVPRQATSRLPPDWFLPPALASDPNFPTGLPLIGPAGRHAQARAAFKIQLAQDDRERREFNRAAALAGQLSTDEIERRVAALQVNPNPTNPGRPDPVLSALIVELGRREALTVENVNTFLRNFIDGGGQVQFVQLALSGAGPIRQLGPNLAPGIRSLVPAFIEPVGAALGLPPVVAAATAIDLLFATNPPDP